MKIDKVIFSTSEEYSDFWYTISKIYKKHLNIEPVCLLFTENEDFSLSQEFGEVKKMRFIPNLPKIIQITWSKFYYTKNELDTVWMIGDIDQIPLQKNYFYNSLKNIPEDYYCHLNYDGCGQTLGLQSDKWMLDGGERGAGFDLPAHYHVARGETYHKTLDLHLNFEQQIKILTNGNYGLGSLPHGKNYSKGSDSYYWIAEEQYSSELIRTNFNNKKINFFGSSYNNRNDRICRNSPNPIYYYDKNKLINGSYIDIHCHRPFKEQETYLNNILKDAFGENINE